MLLEKAGGDADAIIIGCSGMRICFPDFIDNLEE
jgi:Asp/Glu/hydantoin racemase